MAYVFLLGNGALEFPTCEALGSAASSRPRTSSRGFAWLYLETGSVVHDTSSTKCQSIRIISPQCYNFFVQSVEILYSNIETHHHLPDATKTKEPARHSFFGAAALDPKPLRTHVARKAHVGAPNMGTAQCRKKGWNESDWIC